MVTAAVTVESLAVYPIKGAGGVAVDAVEIGPRGPEGDRRWMLVDEHGVFLSQRTHPRLALARVCAAASAWRVTAPGLGELEVPRTLAGGRTVAVRVWKDRVAALEAEPEMSRWFGELLGGPCRLVFMPDSSRRPVDGRYAEDHPVSFADAFPVLLLGRASLDDLNRRLPRPVSGDRFRPNLLVAGAGPYAEDGWAAVEAGGVRLRLVKPCARCVVTTVDQATGVRGAEPLATLASYRTVRGKVMFGQNAVPERCGRVARGDAVTVVR